MGEFDLFIKTIVVRVERRRLTQILPRSSVVLYPGFKHLVEEGVGHTLEHLYVLTLYHEFTDEIDRTADVGDDHSDHHPFWAEPNFEDHDSVRRMALEVTKRKNQSADEAAAFAQTMLKSGLECSA